MSRGRKIIGVILLLLAGQVPASADQAQPDAGDVCRGLIAAGARGLDIRAAGPVQAAGTLPGYCRVAGSVPPAVRFELRLPLAGWNGGFFMAGCGGFCGRILADKAGHANGINVALRRGYAAIVSDAGHQAPTITDAGWSDGNPEAILDYAHQAIPKVADAGMRLTEAFYGRAAGRRYFSGCSNGGRMALIAAQRYPDLFDGIVAGCPVLNLSRSGAVYGAWLLQSNSDAGGEPVFRPERVPALAAAAMAACDTADGLEDGQIDNPIDCDFDPAILGCGTGRRDDGCLTTAEVRVLRQWYGGPRTSAGIPLFHGLLPGSEPFWPVWILRGSGAAGRGLDLAEDYLRYLAFADGPPHPDPARDFDFDRDVARLEERARLFDATDPDLSAFRDAGGKLILYHGLGDPVVLPQQSIAYYEQAAARAGDFERLGRYFRLFLVPGMGHCWETPGVGPDRFDPLAALEDWVEHGKPPAALPASRPATGTIKPRTRPICAFPATARYRGRGSIDLAENFRCTVPTRH